MRINEFHGRHHEDLGVGFLRGKVPETRSFTPIQERRRLSLPDEVVTITYEGRLPRKQLQTTQQIIAMMAESKVERGLSRLFNDIGQMFRDSVIEITSATMS